MNKEVNNRIVALTILSFVIVGLFGGCDDFPHGEYNDAISGCYARYGKDDSSECVRNVNKRFGKE
jgi:hypothetical protein